MTYYKSCSIRRYLKNSADNTALFVKYVEARDRQIYRQKTLLACNRQHLLNFITIRLFPLDYQWNKLNIDIMMYFLMNVTQYRQKYRQKITLRIDDASFEKCRGLLLYLRLGMNNPLIQHRAATFGSWLSIAT